MAIKQQKIELNASKREVIGSGLNGLRKSGYMPAVLYGKKQESVPLQISLRDFHKVFESAGESTLVYINVDGQSYPTIIHDIARDALLPLLPGDVVGLVQRAVVNLALLEVLPEHAGFNESDFIGLERIGSAACRGHVEPAWTVVIGPVRPGHPVLVVQGVHLHGQRELLVVVHTVGAAGLLFRASQGGQKQPGQNGNDRDHDQ